LQLAAVEVVALILVAVAVVALFWSSHPFTFPLEP
jgi:nitrogen fixation-related uncharacterized protein